MRILFSLFFALATVVCSEKIRFDNYRVFSINLETDEHVELMQHIQNTPIDGYSFWTSIRKGLEADLMVAPYRFDEFEEMASENGFTYSVKVEDVQTLIDNERPKIRPRTFGWTDYYTLDEINAWLDEQVAAFSNVLTSIEIGRSYEDRPLRVIRLSHREGNPAVFLESNIHAREWITSATSTWWLNELLTSTDPVIRDLAETIDWYIMPVLNVDGFHYTHTVNRLWRKTRQLHAHICYGTDANRNWDFFWMANGGASSNPCSDTFAGPHIFSEPETAALSEFIGTIASDLKIYFTFHSYGQYILYPYGHDYYHSPHHDDYVSISDNMVTAFAQQFGTDYIAGTAAGALYIASGTSIDYMYDTHNVTIVFTIELRDRRNGPYGFVLPANQILDNCLETRDALVAMIAETRRLGHFD